MKKKLIKKCDLLDSVITRFQQDKNVHELNFSNLPLKLRFNTARDKGSWFFVFSKKVQKLNRDGVLVEVRKEFWRKVGSWPLLDAKKMKEQLPAISANVLAGQNVKTVSADHFETVGELLTWYYNRNEENNTISSERQTQIRSTIKKQLMPLLETLPIKAVSKINIEEKMLWPLQRDKYAIATIKAYFNILKAAFECANELGMISYNPMLEIRFKNSFPKGVPTKDGKLKPGHIPELMKLTDGEPSLAKTLVYMMLSHSTRQGETRKARWSHIDLSNMTWYLPTENIKTKEHEHTLPITDEVFEYLKSHRNFLKSKGYEGDYIFPSNLRNPKCSPISKATACRLIKAISSGEWTSHDIRKLASTTWQAHGEDYLIRKFLLNHHIPNLDKTYMQAVVEPQKREVLTRWQVFLTQEKNKTIARW
ncbi:tyrosine-type recombinase/integrase [Vibrio parahaemolyticus]|nr:tyrosine-type recombinase/integrase [Vibrio parahaemolyticus]ELB2030717.1 tyrosine-type recombinase/integrase [Vibrio parahaemolyticus]ELB2219732.1 tyrosine-type recombinase/integrase [Vibrio parahaemolyticus]